MAKQSTVYVCGVCGAKTHKWQGRCFECGAYNSFVEETISTKSSKQISLSVLKNKNLKDITIEATSRIKLGIPEVDELLAGGLVPGQTVLVGGEPGIGKSTLLLQLADKQKSIYIAGEESMTQIKIRAKRLGLTGENVDVIDERDVDTLSAYLEKVAEENDTQPLVIVDSIQSVFSTHIKSVAGSIAQVQYCASVLNEIAKKYALPMIIVGQITKSGYLAGPKMLEHLVDTVLYFYGDRKAQLRALRVVKNRFGPAQGLELFIMTGAGLESADPYLAELIANPNRNVPGTIFSVVLEGARPLIVEVQALVVPSKFSNPRHVVNGYSSKRVEMLLAVIAKRLGINIYSYDLFLNISGGIRVDDYALDLPIVLAILSVVKNKKLPTEAVAFGEIGLLGEVKKVPSENLREKEAKKHGLAKIISAATSPLLKEIAKKTDLIK